MRLTVTLDLYDEDVAEITLTQVRSLLRAYNPGAASEWPAIQRQGVQGMACIPRDLQDAYEALSACIDAVGAATAMDVAQRLRVTRAQAQTQILRALLAMRMARIPLDVEGSWSHDMQTVLYRRVSGASSAV